METYTLRKRLSRPWVLVPAKGQDERFGYCYPCCDDTYFHDTWLPGGQCNRNIAFADPPERGLDLLWGLPGHSGFLYDVLHLWREQGDHDKPNQRLPFSINLPGLWRHQGEWNWVARIGHQQQWRVILRRRQRVRRLQKILETRNWRFNDVNFLGGGRTGPTLACFTRGEMMNPETNSANNQ